MDNMINGETSACDGTVEGFSSFLNILNSLENESYEVLDDSSKTDYWTEFLKVVT